MSLEGMSKQQLAQHAAHLEDLILQHADSLRMPNASVAAETVSNARSVCDRCVKVVQHQPVAIYEVTHPFPCKKKSATVAKHPHRRGSFQ